MQRVIIDCQSRKEIVEEMTPEEVSIRLAEIESFRKDKEKERKKEIKNKLLQALLEIQEMKSNPLIFSSQDIAEKQAIIDDLKNKI